MRRKIVIFFILLINLISLSGCYIDIDRQIMVSGIAIDEGQHDFGHCKAIFIGEKLAKKELVKSLISPYANRKLELI